MANFLWKEVDSFSTPINKDLKIVNMDGSIRLTSGNYTQSKKVDDGWKEGYWSYQTDSVDLSLIKKPKVLILGFGGGTIATLLKKKYSNIVIDGVDLDPKMVEWGKSYLGLDIKDINIHISDAFEFIKKTKKKYDLVIVDIFTEGSVPNYLKKIDFFQAVKEVLTDEGAMTVNRIFNLDRFFIDPFTGGKQEYQRFVKMLKEVFVRVEVLEVPGISPTRNYIFKGNI